MNRKSASDHSTGTWFWKQPHLSRRVFFRHAASAVGGYYLLPARPFESCARAAVSPMATARNCIFVLMSGGPSHVDTFDLKEGPWTPAGFEPESYGELRWPRGLLPTLAGQLDSIALLRSARAWAAVHDLARNWTQIARNPTSAMARIAPHIGSVVSMELGGNSADRLLPAFVSLNTGAGGPGSGYFPPEQAPFFISPSGNGLGNTAHPAGAAAFERRYGLLRSLAGEHPESDLGPAFEEMAQFNVSARKLMYNSAVDRIFVFNQEERARYGNNAFGNACITARNLLKADLGTRFVQITVGGWDNHAGIYTGAFNAENANSLARRFDAGLGTLLADLKENGLLDQTLVVALGEFGRTVGNPNQQAGRDHHLQQAVLFAGARIRGSRAIGSSDSEGYDTAETGWARSRPVRAEDIAATIYSAMGINWTHIRRDDPLGRGFEYIPFADRDEYGPVHELWG